MGRLKFKATPRLFSKLCTRALWSFRQILVFSNRMCHGKVSFARKYDRFMMLILTIASQETFVTRSGGHRITVID